MSTFQGRGWAGTKIGALLERASGQCDVFVTMDGNIDRQQSLVMLPFGVVIIGAASNRMADLLPVVPELLPRAADLWVQASLDTSSGSSSCSSPRTSRTTANGSFEPP